MTEIYENAEQVIVWLRLLNGNTDLAFDLLEKLSKLTKSKLQY
jgi:hypothetical protein